jgi:hypothetical protein
VSASSKHAAMLERLERYASLRGEGVLPADAATEVGIRSFKSAKAYERWYRRERRGLADRPQTWPHFPEWPREAS